jgi:predicted MFS family arabinose efflux permease
MSVTNPTRGKTAKPFPWTGLIVLASAVFLSVTGETLPTGLLPDMSASLHVSEPAVGLLVTIFAFTVVATTAPLTALTRRWPRHAVIVIVLAVLGLSNLLTALAPSYGLIVVIRLLGGMAHGLFWAVVGAYAGHMVPKEQIGRAVSITLGGGTLAIIFGVPLGTFVGHAFGWRLSFGALAILMFVGALLALWLLPVIHREDTSLRTAGGTIVKQRDRTIPAVVLVCVLASIVMIGQFALYTYIAPFMIDVMGIDPSAIGTLLFVYGIAGAGGLLLSGSVLGGHPQRSLVIAIVVTGAAVAALALFASLPVLGIAALVLWGLAFGALPPLLQTRMLHASSPAFRDTASALYTTAFNVGIGGGALIGALLYGAVGVEDLPWVYVGVLVIALVLTLLTELLARRQRSAGAAAGSN